MSKGYIHHGYHTATRVIAEAVKLEFWGKENSLPVLTNIKLYVKVCTLLLGTLFDMS